MRRLFLFLILILSTSCYALQKNVASQKWSVFAFDRTDNTAKTGDAANITGAVYIDGVANTIDDTNPTELANGFYIFDIAQAESNGNYIVMNATSTTADIQVVGCPMALWTMPANIPALSIGADGLVASNLNEIMDDDVADGGDGLLDVNIKEVGDDDIQDNGDGRLEVNVEEIKDVAVSTTTAQLGVNIVQISEDSVAADYLEDFWDEATTVTNFKNMYSGTGYAGGTIKLDVDTVTIEAADATDTINAQCDASIETYSLDQLISAAVADEVVNDSIIAKLVSKDATADWSDYSWQTESLESLKDGVLADILTDTAVIGAAGAGLTAVPWNAAWDAEVESEVEDAVGADVTSILGDTGTDGVVLAADSVDSTSVHSDALDAIVMSDLSAGAPSPTATIKVAINWLYSLAINKLVTNGTNSEVEYYNNAGTKIAEADVSDDGTDFTRSKIGAND